MSDSNTNNDFKTVDPDDDKPSIPVTRTEMPQDKPPQKADVDTGATSRSSPESKEAAPPPPEHKTHLDVNSNADTSEEDSPATMKSDDVNPADRMKRHLAELHVVPAEKWDEAASLVGSIDDIPKILQQLKNMPANREISGEGSTILTDFQIEKILAGQAQTLRLQHYLILHRLGAGGMGEVFKAWNSNLERLEAIKTIVIGDADEGTAGHTQGLARFEQEAKVLAQLDHDHITTIYHAGRGEHGVSFIAMEYVAGQDMKGIVESALADGDSVPVWWATERCMAIAEALQHAHSKKVIHRDIKPSNIMITEKDELKVLDMGIARLARPSTGSGKTSRLTQSATGLGTPEVMPPEQWADATAVTPASDIYSLGCTYFYMLTGHMPFEGDSLNALMFAHVNDAPPKASSLRDDVPAGLDKVINKMLAKRPEDRYRDCGELIKALRPFATHPAEKVINGDGNRKKKKKTALIGVASVLAVVVSLGVYQLVKPPPPTPPLPIDDPPLAVDNDPEEKDPDVDPNSTSTGKTPDSEPDVTPPVVDKREEAESWLRRIQSENEEVYPSISELRKIAFESSDGPLSEKDFDRLKKKVQSDLSKRWLAWTNKQLAEYQKSHSAAWLDVESLRQWASTNGYALEKIKSTQDLQKLLTALEPETAFREWLAEHMRTHKRFWKDGEQEEFLASKFPNPIRATRDVEERKRAVIEESQRLVRNAVQPWLDEFQKKNSQIWDSLTSLVKVAQSRGLIDNVRTPESFDAFVADLRDLTEALKHPFENLKVNAPNEVERWQTETMLKTYEWLLGLQATQRDPGLKVELEMRRVDEDQPVERVKIGQAINVYVKSSQATFLTMLVRTNTQVVLIRPPDQLPEDEWKLAAGPVPADAAAVSHFLAVFTAKPPPEVTPIPMGGAKKLVIQSKDQVERLKQGFVDPLIYDRVVEAVMEDEMYPFVKPLSNVPRWNRKLVTVEVVEN